MAANPAWLSVVARRVRPGDNVGARWDDAGMSQPTPLPTPDPDRETKVRSESSRLAFRDPDGNPTPTPGPEPERETAVRSEAASTLTSAVDGAAPTPQPMTGQRSHTETLVRSSRPVPPEPEEETRTRSEVARHAAYADVSPNLLGGNTSPVPMPDPDPEPDPEEITHSRVEAARSRPTAATMTCGSGTVLSALAMRQARMIPIGAPR